MYVQITTLCNMACDHCCFSCGPTKPFEHMSERVLDQCLHLGEAAGAHFQIGGGEPTCHPEFWRYLRKAVTSQCDGVWLATNGKRTKYALALATLAGTDGWYELHQQHIDETCDPDDESEYSYGDSIHPWIDGTSPEDWEKLYVALSDDHYHDPINERVRALFLQHGHELRDVEVYGNAVANMGAAKENHLGGAERCACQEVHIKPNGDVYLCGCSGSLPLGSVFHYSTDEWCDLLNRISETEEVHGQCGYYGLGLAVDEDGDQLNAPEDCDQRQLDMVIEYILTGEGWDGEGHAPWNMDQEKAA